MEDKDKMLKEYVLLVNGMIGWVRDIKEGVVVIDLLDEYVLLKGGKIGCVSGIKRGIVNSIGSALKNTGRKKVNLNWKKKIRVQKRYIKRIISTGEFILEDKIGEEEKGK